MRTTLALCALALLAGCATEPAPPATLPASATPGRSLQDEAVLVGQDIAAFYRRPQPGQPAAAARAIAEIEWLAAYLPNSPRWSTASPAGMNQLQLARNEARAALGIPPRAPTQQVINGLTGAATALAANDSAAVARALPRGTFPLGPEETVRRLAAPPPNRNIMAALFALSAARRGGGNN
jgi:hypothetical protein